MCYSSTSLEMADKVGSQGIPYDIVLKPTVNS